MECDEGSTFYIETPDASAVPEHRPVAYLDQNQWSTISKALYDPDSQSAENVQAAQQVARWCDRKQLRLPVSIAHLLETTHWTDRRRREHLALTLLRLSRGWQMCHPLDIRRDEIMAHLAGEGAVPRESVFTTSPAATYLRDDGLAPEAPPDLPESMARQYAALTACSTFTAVLLDPDPVPRDSASLWAAVNQQVSDAVDMCGTKSSKMTLVDQNLIVDLGPAISELAEAIDVTLALPEPGEATKFWKPFSSCQSLMTYRQAVLAKHLDRGSRWESNDLIDLTFLSTASAYADAVACERKAANLLRRALRALSSQTPVVTNLTELVDVLGCVLAPPAGH